MSAKNHGSQAVRLAVAMALGTVTLGAFAPMAWAADADASVNKPASDEATAPLEEVTVTGSRIRRKDLASTSPLVTIDSEQLEQRAGLNIESYLSQLPQFNPALTPTNLGTNQDVQATPVNSVGIATISLRGFGANRSLVLIDGHRSTPINLQMVTDINSIPSAMIDRVEIITGGASAVYGADAIGGVTNFITKKNYEGASVDMQDGITQVGDGNELRVTTLMGSKIADGRGNIAMGMEYYNRDAAYQKNRKFFVEGFTDPGTSITNGFFNGGGIAALSVSEAVPSTAAVNTLFANRIAAGGSPFGFGSTGAFASYGFNSNGTICQCSLGGITGPYQTSNWTGQTTTGGYGLYNEYDPSMSAAGTAATPPNVVQGVKRSDITAYASSPQTRYSFFSNGNFDITDKIQFYTEARFEQSLTHTYLTAPPSVIGGWQASIPFNEATDSPINPASISPTTSAATLATIYNAFVANPTNAGGTNPYYNPAFVGPATKGAQHPVPWQLAMLLDTRSAAFGGALGALGSSPAFGGPVSCNNTISPALCATAPLSWELNWTPKAGLPPRNTVDTTQVWQIDTGFRFPLMVTDWTGDVYYSRGQSSDITHAYGNESLQRLETVLASPDYGQGQTFQGNLNNGAAGFGNGVPPTCTSGFYNSIFGGDVAPSADCQHSVFAITTSQTFIQQDNMQANFSGTLFKLPAGDVSGAFGYEYRRDSGQFIPDTLNSTGSFLDQTLGLYPLGSMDNEISSRDGYLELLVPVVKDLPFLKALNLDLGGRYSTFNTGDNSTTFKINVDATLTNSLRIRGGYNRANRAPNIGELYLPTQQQFGGGALFNDPCSLRSNSPFGAAGPAIPDMTTTKTQAQAPLVNAQGAAGQLSTYLICLAQMASTPTSFSTSANGFYGTNGNQTPAGFSAFPDQQGNPNLKSETANTWTGGLVFAALSDRPWLAGLSGSIDWWQVRIDNAIELDSGDYANFLCYGGTPVTTSAQAAAVAATQDCLNVARNPTNGTPASSLQVYTNQATIETAGVDLAVNWISQLSDLGLTAIPGSLSINSQDTFLNYYRTKTSTAYFDPTINWKDSMGPTLAGTNGGAYGYRLNLGLGYILPSFGVNLNWRFLPSVNSATVPQNQAIIDYNNKQVAAGKTAANNFLSYSPNTTIAVPAWYQFDLTANWNINKTFSLRAGIDNLFDKQPPIVGATTGHPVGTNLASLCPTGSHGCTPVTAYSLPNDGAGQTNGSYYDLYGRTFFIGAKAQF
ncbi:MAG TPA: TonB-dependent receptor [Steroidobacteraceae bacterium]|nr:TonB-dependent receptor [Steroidobacteraceae bacterium]